MSKLNAGAASFTPGQGFNANAKPFVPGQSSASASPSSSPSSSPPQQQYYQQQQPQQYYQQQQQQGGFYGQQQQGQQQYQQHNNNQQQQRSSKQEQWAKKHQYQPPNQGQQHHQQQQQQQFNPAQMQQMQHQMFQQFIHQQQQQGQQQQQQGQGQQQQNYYPQQQPQQGQGQQQFQQQQQQVVPRPPLGEDQARSILASVCKIHMKRPLVFLFLGPRGSGKSTQAQLLAKRLNLAYFSSGEAITHEKKDPFRALVDTLDELLATFKSKTNDNENNKKKSGIVLDRFIMTGTIDTLFLLHVLQSRGLQLDHAFVLNASYLESQQRAGSRDREDEHKKDVAFRNRMAEHNAIFEATNVVLKDQPGVLFNVECEEGATIGQVHKQISDETDKLLCSLSSPSAAAKGHLLRPFPASKLPIISSSSSSSSSSSATFPQRIVLDPNVLLWLQLRDALHIALKTPSHAPFNRFPGSNIGGVLCRQSLEETIIPYARKMQVTYKADGLRVMVVRSNKHGTFIVTPKFLGRFVFEASDLWFPPALEAAHGAPSKFESEEQKEEYFNKIHPFDSIPDMMRQPTEDDDQQEGEEEKKKEQARHREEEELRLDITHVIDAELVLLHEHQDSSSSTSSSSEKLPPWRLYAFDCLVNNGVLMTNDQFTTRYDALKRFFNTLEDSFTSASSSFSSSSSALDSKLKDKYTKAAAQPRHFVLKQFIPVQDIKRLIATPTPPEFPIDGLLFQQPGKYIVPRDSRSFKWKVPSQCTVDFRLSNGWFDEKRKVWIFIPCVVGNVPASSSSSSSSSSSAVVTTSSASAMTANRAGSTDSQQDKQISSSNKRDEVPFERAIVEIPEKEIGNFADGSIAECVQVRLNLGVEQQQNQLQQGGGGGAYKASGGGGGSSSAATRSAQQQQQQLLQLLSKHPLAEPYAPLHGHVTRQLPSHFSAFWRSDGGAMATLENKEFTTEMNLTLWKVVRDRSGDKPAPNAQGIAEVTSTMEHVGLVELVTSVAKK